jgi:hypothetical protein
MGGGSGVEEAAAAVVGMVGVGAGAGASAVVVMVVVVAAGGVGGMMGQERVGGEKGDGYSDGEVAR